MRIDYDLIFGNIIILMNKQTIMKEDIYKCLELVDNINEYYLIGNPNVDAFLDYYNFLFCDLDDEIKVVGDNKTLERYFKIGVPKEIISICNMAISKLKESKKLVKKNNKGLNNKFKYDKM